MSACHGHLCDHDDDNSNSDSSESNDSFGSDSDRCSRKLEYP